MGRGAADDRPAIEVWGEGSAGDDAPERVVVGGRGPRRGGLVLAAVVAVLLVAGLVLGDGGGEGGDTTTPATREERDNRARDDLEPPPVGAGPSTTRAPRPTTTTTSTTQVFGPVLGTPSGAAVVVAREGPTWTWLGLDDGVRGAIAVETSDPWSVVPLRGGVAVLRGGRARWVPLTGPGDPPWVDLGPADQLMGSGLPDAVWLISGAGPGAESAARLTGIDGVVRRSLTLTGPSYFSGGTPQGLVFGLAGRAYLATPAGTALVADGELLAVTNPWAALLRCDDEAVCQIVARHLSSGAEHVLQTSAPIGPIVSGVLLAEDGHAATLDYTGDEPSLALFDSDGSPLGATVLPLDVTPVWLPGEPALLVRQGAEYLVLRPHASGALVPEAIPALDGVRGDRVYVIPG